MADNDLKRFNMLIQNLEGGALNDELSDEVRNCVQEIADACADRGGTHEASITLTLKFSMNHKDKIIDVVAGLSKKLPKAPRGRAGSFWCDGDGNLTRENPRQMTFEDELRKKRDESTLERSGVVNGD